MNHGGLILMGNADDKVPSMKCKIRVDCKLKLSPEYRSSTCEIVQ